MESERESWTSLTPKRYDKHPRPFHMGKSEEKSTTSRHWIGTPFFSVLSIVFAMEEWTLQCWPKLCGTLLQYAMPSFFKGKKTLFRPIAPSPPPPPPPPQKKKNAVVMERACGKVFIQHCKGALFQEFLQKRQRVPHILARNLKCGSRESSGNGFLAWLANQLNKLSIHFPWPV